MNISLAAEPLFYIGSFPFTNALLVSWIVVAFLLLVARAVKKNFQEIPRGFQNAVEAILEILLGYADSVTGDRAKSLRFFPVVASLFFLILFSNWIGLLPGVGTIGLNQIHNGHEVLVPFLRSSSADLNFTIALAIASVVAAQIFGMRALGSLRYWRKFFTPPWKQPYGVGTFVGLLELISEFAKIISFSFRLFGNIFAGEVLLLVMGLIAPFLAPIPFLFLEIFVGLVQAAVFSMLSLVFFTIAVESHDDHDEKHHGESASEKHLEAAAHT